MMSSYNMTHDDPINSDASVQSSNMMIRRKTDSYIDKICRTLQRQTENIFQTSKPKPVSLFVIYLQYSQVSQYVYICNVEVQ